MAAATYAAHRDCTDLIPPLAARLQRILFVGLKTAGRRISSHPSGLTRFGEEQGVGFLSPIRFNSVWRGAGGSTGEEQGVGFLSPIRFNTVWREAWGYSPV